MTGKTKYKVGLSDCAHVSFDIFEFNLHLTFSYQADQFCACFFDKNTQNCTQDIQHLDK